MKTKERHLQDLFEVYKSLLELKEEKIAAPLKHKFSMDELDANISSVFNSMCKIIPEEITMEVFTFSRENTSLFNHCKYFIIWSLKKINYAVTQFSTSIRR